MNLNIRDVTVNLKRAYEFEEAPIFPDIDSTKIILIDINRTVLKTADGFYLTVAKK